MAIQITAERMTSDQTPQFAVPAPEAVTEYGAWIASWLPGRRITRGQAITAMTIAEVVATQDVSPEGYWWPFLLVWAAELQLTGPDALTRASVPPAGEAGS